MLYFVMSQVSSLSNDRRAFNRPILWERDIAQAYDIISFKIAYRIFPKNDQLPHRQDFCYVKWFL